MNPTLTAILWSLVQTGIYIACMVLVGRREYYRGIAKGIEIEKLAHDLEAGSPARTAMAVVLKDWQPHPDRN